MPKGNTKKSLQAIRQKPSSNLNGPWKKLP